MSRRVSDTSHSRANSHRPTYSPICQSLKKVHPISVTYLTQVSILLSSSAYYFLRPLTLIQCRHHHILAGRSEEHTSELLSLMRISYAVFCLKNNILITHLFLL